MRRWALGISIALGLFAGANAFAATTFTVTTLADTTGSCTDSSCTTLRAAIAAANSSAGNTINFTGLSGTITLTSALPNITQNMTITGPGASSLTISGNNAYQIFNISPGTVAISGLTLANATATGTNGGAIYSSGTLTVSNCTFSQNSTTGSGGAIENVGDTGTLTVINSTFSGNSAVSGGAIYSSGTLTVIASSFSGNSANAEGGAVDYVDNINNNPPNGFTLTVIDSSFSGNSTQNNDGIGTGGAIGIEYGTASIMANNTFSGNSADIGGAIYLDDGSATADNNIFTGSTASYGAAIYSIDATVNADHNLYYQNLGAGNTEDDCFNCTSNTNAISANPNLLPLGFYGGPTQTLLPQPGSPAICAGSYADVPNGTTTDQRGFPLISSTCGNGGVDVGAVQSDYVQVTNTNDSGTGSLRAAMIAADIGSYGADIVFASNVTGTLTLQSGLPSISQSMNFIGPGASTLTISGNNYYQIFNISSSSSAFISGLTLANGSSDQTDFGGGAVYNAGTLTMTNSTFTGNSGNSNSGGGAGGAIDNVGTLMVTNCTFSGNSALGGGALTAYGTTTVISSTFSQNAGPLGGGAIDSGGFTTVINSTFSGDSANESDGDFGGGAIESFNGTLTVLNSTFSGNSTSSRGGAIDSFNGATMVAYNNIFTGNSATYSGAGIVDLGGTVSADYNLYYQNLDAGSTEDDCNACTTNTNAMTGSNPLLAALGSYGGPTQSMLPQPGSPAICAGSTALIPTGITTDQRGFSRTTTYSGTTCVDLGAVQTNYTAIAFSSSSYSGMAPQAVNPAPVVTVTENGQNIGGVPITLEFSGTGSPTGLGPVTTVGGTGATFSSLTASSATQGTLSVTLPITASGNAVQPAALTASATLDIQLTTQAITFVAASPVIYGTAPIMLTATGGASGNPVTFSLDPTTSPGAASLSGSTLTIHGVGTIVIDANQAAGGGYAAAAQVQQTIVVSPASLTVTASSPTVTYGSAVPTITPIFGTFFNGDTSAALTTQPTCVTAYTATSAVGSSPSTSCSGAAAANYTFTYINGSVTVNPAPTQTIAFVAPSSLTYGSAPITLTATGGASGNPVVFTLSTLSTPGAASLSGSTLTIHGVGTIVIDANQAAGGGYAAAAQVQQTIVVSPASLTVTASSPMVTYGSAVPTITPIFGAFFNGDTSAVLTTQPTCVTAYTTTSAVGSSLSTSCSGAAAANYTFTYINGSMTVNPAPVFAIGGGSTSISIEPGATTGNTVPITITPSNGFAGTVDLSCSISPVAAGNPPTCSLSPASVTIIGTGAQTSTLTISTTASTVSENRLNRLLWPSGGTALALVLVIGVPRRRRAWLTMLGMLALSIAVTAIGCSGGGSSSGGGTSGSSATTPGTYTITVTGTSGNVTGTAGTVTLTVQ